MGNVQIEDMTPAELRAIMDHKYFMSQEQGKEVSIDEAITDFLQRYIDQWRLEKTRADNMTQVAIVKEHMANGGEIEEWTEKYAPIWRQERESLEKNGFLTRWVTIKNDKGLHVGPSGKLIKLARKYDCDLYIHKEGMEYYNFKLNGKPYMNIRSVLAVLEILSLAVGKGQRIEFLAFGKQAKEALDEIENVTNNKFGEAK